MKGAAFDTLVGLCACAALVGIMYLIIYLKEVIK